jgi:hypothetical protein
MIRRPLVPHRVRRILAAALFLVAPTGLHLTAQTLPTTADCVGCHLQLEDSILSAPARTYATDIHAERGFGCLVCHGGPRTGHGTLDPDAGFLSVPERRDIPALCGRCHSDAAFMRDYNPSVRVDQVTEYYSSVHGRLLRENDDPDVAVCVSCHPAHRIRPPSDPSSTVHPLNVADLCASCHADSTLMAPRGLPTDQMAAYRNSVHGTLLYDEGDVSAPTCNDCHGNHGAAPPGVSSVHNVCGQCHSVMNTYFEASGHTEPFDSAGLPGCVTCHGNHGIRTPVDQDLILRADSVCTDCHQEGTPADDQFRIMASLFDSLLTARDDARAVLDSAENAGMLVSQPLFDLQEVDNSITQARSSVHSFRADTVAEQIDEGFTTIASARREGEDALDEHRFRRIGLAASTGIILVLVLSLLARIRALDRRVEATPFQPGASHE